MGAFVVVLMVALVALSLGSSRVDGSRHHVVGEDRGWAPASNIALWSADKDFIVGDTIWFTYSAAEESISELRTKEEFERCDLRNPIKMYTDGVDKVTLDGQGPRYFTSAKAENCKNGLKLHIDVQPENAIVMKKPMVVQALAAAPSSSGSVIVQGGSGLLLFGLLSVLYSIGN